MKLLAIMDPIDAIHVKKDTTVALLMEAQRKNWEIAYCTVQDLFYTENEVQVLSRDIQVKESQAWAHFKSEKAVHKLSYFDIILMRKDPPVDKHYLYATYLLELAQSKGCYVVNNPRAIRDANEKLFTLWFPDCCPPMLVSPNIDQLRDFLRQHKKIVVKPLHAMAGESIFLLNENDLNTNVTLELLTQQETTHIMAQRFIPDIAKGDKRILMICGKPYPYSLTRLPASDDFRGNLAKGATGQPSELSPEDLSLCEKVGLTLKEKGLLFVGLDVIGNFITEINVTSPTGVREIEAANKVNICEEILNRLIENKP